MPLYLISDDIQLRARWISVFIAFKPKTLSQLTLDFADQSIVFVLDTLIHNCDAIFLQKLFMHRVMVLSLTPDFSQAQRYLELGAMGYGNAMMHQTHLHSVYQALEEGKIWLQPDFITSLISQFKSSSTNEQKKYTDILDVLSNREKDVALLLGEGKTHLEIADQLNITVRTIKAHATSIYQKLGVKDRLALSILLHS